jgi:tetraacyldisaccharide-1-P 4'-kinase
MKHHLFLLGAIVAEVVATSALKASEGFTRWGPTALVVVGYALAFWLLLRGIVPQFDTQALGDHAQITPATLAALDADIIVMTEKDAVKCAAFADRRCWALAVCARLDPALPTWLEEHLNGPSPA